MKTELKTECLCDESGIQINVTFTAEETAGAVSVDIEEIRLVIGGKDVLFNDYKFDMKKHLSIAHIKFLENQIIEQFLHLPLRERF